VRRAKRRRVNNVRIIPSQDTHSVKKQERADRLLVRLDQLYPDPPIPLDHGDEFTLLVAVLLSAQCTDKKVNEVTPELFRVAGTPQAMKQLGEAKILEIIRPLGLSKQKAKSLAKLSAIISDQFGGRVPRSFEQLETLPGVGHKTASVVMAQAFGVPAFPVDTHIHRLAQRWGLSSGNSVVQTERDLKKLFPESSWNKLHLQIIFYGREHCTARGCDGTKCELCRELYPRRKKPVLWKKP
jgi:endonuclease-3